MCQTVVINQGAVEIGTVKQFKAYFRIDTVIPENAYDTINEDACLCQIDVGSELKKIGVSYGYDHSDYYVGHLDELQKNCPDMEFWFNNAQNHEPNQTPTGREQLPTEGE